MNPRQFLFVASFVAVFAFARAEEVPLVSGVEPQPFFAAVRQTLEAVDLLGSPLDEPSRRALDEALAAHDAAAVEKAQRALDASALLVVHISPESARASGIGAWFHSKSS